MGEYPFTREIGSINLIGHTFFQILCMYCSNRMNLRLNLVSVQQIPRLPVNERVTRHLRSRSILSLPQVNFRDVNTYDY